VGLQGSENQKLYVDGSLVYTGQSVINMTACPFVNTELKCYRKKEPFSRSSVLATSSVFVMLTTMHDDSSAAARQKQCDEQPNLGKAD
jgi:hypothetical protein